MNCNECGSKLLVDTECENTYYCKQCKVFSGDNCKDPTCECGGELKQSSSGSDILCTKCGNIKKVGEEEEVVEKRELPPLTEQAANFGKSMVNFAASGFKTTGKGDYDRRLSICHACPANMFNGGRCMDCGCVVALKAKVETEKCPLGFWDKEKNEEI